MSGPRNINGTEAFRRGDLAPGVGALQVSRRRGGSLFERTVHTVVSATVILAFVLLVLAGCALLEQAS